MKQELKRCEMLSSAMNLIDDALIEETEALRDGKLKKKGRLSGSMTAGKKRKLKRAIAAACVVLVAAGSIAGVRYQKSKLPLSEDSQNVVVRYTNEEIDIGVACFVDIPEEEEIFDSLRADKKLDVIKGTVTKIENIVINFSGSKTHEAIAQIRVDEVYQGTLKKGSLITTNISAPVDTGDVLYHLSEGTEGIFMPTKYKNDDIWEENGGRLALKDIAEYSIGEFTTFLQTREGLLFDKEIYKSIPDAQSLSQVEAYIKKELD